MAFSFPANPLPNFFPAQPNAASESKPHPIAIESATTHCPAESTNSRPIANPADAVAWQYATRAIERNEPVIVAIVNRSPTFQRLVLRTRAPFELTFSVNVVSVPGNIGFPEM